MLEAQSPQAKQNSIQVLKVAFITKDLFLTAEEAQKFWPVYNSYTEELKKVRKDYKNDVLGGDEKSLVIKRKYNIDFKKILFCDKKSIYN